MPTFPLDVAGPGLIVALGLGVAAGLAAFVAVALVEAGILTVLRWSGVGRALLAAVVMNVASGVVGLFLIGFVFSVGYVVWLSLAFVLSVLIEAGVLALMDRPKARLGAIASLAANLATYIPLAALVYFFLRNT